jgi:hypothetical protein
MFRDTVTDLLDLLALLLLAAGLAAAAHLLIGWACLAVAALVVGAGSQVAHRLGRPPAAPGGGQ